jgi:hypothetical protein
VPTLPTPFRPRNARFSLLLLAQAALVAGLAIALRSGAMPLGVRGEWEWLRVPAAPAWGDLVLACAAVAALSGLAASGMRALQGGESGRPEVLGLLGA